MYNDNKEFRTVAHKVFSNNYSEDNLRFIRVDLCNVSNLLDKIDIRSALSQIASKLSYIDSCFDGFVNHVLQLYSLSSVNKVVHYPYSAIFIVPHEAKLYKSLLAFQEEFNLNLIKQGSPLHVRMGSVVVSTKSGNSGFSDMSKVFNALQENVDSDCPYRSFINEDKTWKEEKFEDVTVNDVAVVDNINKNYYNVLSKFNIVAYALIDFDKTRDLFVQWLGHLREFTQKTENLPYSISHMSMLSNKIYSFFKNSAGRIHENIAPLFLTGQSLLVVGGWREVFNWITKTKAEFTNNFKDPKATISAAITVCKSSTPFVLIYSNLMDRLKIAKNEGGDNVSVWDVVNTWSSFEDGLKFGKNLINLCKDGFISKGMLYKLYDHCKGGMHGNSELLPVLLAQISKQYKYSSPDKIEKLEELCKYLRKSVSHSSYKQLMLSVSYALTSFKEGNGN